MISTFPGRPTRPNRPNRPGRPNRPNRPTLPADDLKDRPGVRVYDTNRFLVQGTVIDWNVVRQNYDLFSPAEDIAAQRNISTRIVQLRWLMNPTQLGYPTEPFKVWRKPTQSPDDQAIEPTVLKNPFGQSIVRFDQPYIAVRAQMNALQAGGFVVAFAGAPFDSQIVDVQTLKQGFNLVRIKGSAIQSLVVSRQVTLSNFHGADPNVINSSSWELIEQVGLPVSWSRLHNLDQPQGLVGALGAPAAAALDRYRRGAPFYGWQLFMEPGMAAPPWTSADPEAIITTMEDHLLGDLRTAIETYPPVGHHEFSQTRTLPASRGRQSAIAQFNPFQHLIFGIASDPLLALTAGFGTAFNEEKEDAMTDSDAISDYMVTARYENGLDGESGPVEYAAILFAPALATPPIQPVNLKTTTAGHQAPLQRDLSWKGLVRLDWEKVSDFAKVRVASYAAARFQQQPAGGVTPLMTPRQNDSALQPISATTSEDRTLKAEPLSFLDDRYEVASAPANNSLRYGVAHQDWFGLWSPWSTTGHTISEPEAQPASLLSARLEVVPPASGTICPATLVLDIAWDWKVRSPRYIDIVGRLYQQTKRGDPPANLTVPNKLPSALLNPGGAPLRLHFDGDDFGQIDAHPSLNGTLQYLSEDGRTFLASPPETRGPRRYRLTITGFSLNYANAGHIGLALWARGRENRAPQRHGPWTNDPLIASASDPRAPVITGTHENVLLASVADASGEHHALLEWSSYPGAVGYFVYTASETQIRADRDLGEAHISQTLSQRLAALRDAFATDPNRQSFTRVNATQIEERQLSVTLPRGSKEIHFYLVIGVGAGQVESAWPSAADPDLRLRPIAYAAPQIVPPAPPTLEVRQTRDDTTEPPTYRAWLQAKTNPGATVSRLDIHRVRVPAASLSLDSMGPPIASLSGSEGLWEVTPTESDRPGVDQPIGTLTGTDTPTGSWKPVYYRAVAWSIDQPERGIYGSRSLPSAAREVLIPPTAPPHLSPQINYEYAANNRIIIRFSSAAPVAETPLGPHRIKVSVYGNDYDYHYPSLANGVLADNALTAVRQTPGIGQRNRFWRTSIEPAGTTQYNLRLTLPRNMRLQVSVELIDPLGRVSDRTRTIPRRRIISNS